MEKIWLAKWIWPYSNITKRNTYVEFRHDFLIEGVSSEITLNISARNEYILTINGQTAGRGPSPSDSDWQYYDTYEIGEYLIEGMNIIGVTCYHFGEQQIITNQMQGSAGFICQIEAAGQIIAITDENWKSRISPRWGKETERISLWGGYKEIYLASQEDGWESTGYDDSTWAMSNVIASVGEELSPWPRLISREIPFLHTEIIKPRSIVRIETNFGFVDDAEDNLESFQTQGDLKSMIVDASNPGSLPSVVYDFEREVVGRVLLDIDAPQGAVVRVAYGESLELQSIDTFILKSGKNELTSFGRRACRFIQIICAATPVQITVNKVSFELTHYPYEHEGRFISSDETINKIWEISKYTTIMNSHDHLEDCPWREKALWVVDAVVMGKVIYYTFADTQMMRKCLKQGARIQNADGSIPGTGPERNSMLLPDFCAYWIIGVFDYWNYTGDQDLLTELWPNMLKVVGWFNDQIDESGLFAKADRPGWWCFIDWSNDIDKRDKVAGISFLYAKVLEQMAAMALAIGEPYYADEALHRREILLHAIRKHLWVSDKKLFADCLTDQGISSVVTLQTNFLAAWCGITSNDEVMSFLVEYYDKKVLPSVKGPFFQHIVIEVLTKFARKQQAFDLIQSYWGEMVARGATTWWETFDAATPHCTIPSTYQGNTPTYLNEIPPVSLCHAWGASPSYLLPRILMGVDVSRVGHGILELFLPHFGLNWVKGEIPTAYGRIFIEWRIDNNGILGFIQIPKDLIVQAPAGYPLQIIILE
jgi:alpha-L-rhamnosidase